MPAKDSQLTSELEKLRRAVDVDHYDLTLRELLRMTEAGELKRAPEYQRKFRWKPTEESRFIESLFLGLPIPSIFVATNADGTWEIVDGLQRISTLAHFATESPELLLELKKDSALELADLEKLTTFNGMQLKDLPTPIRLQFFKRSLRVTALSDKSDPEVRFDTFERLNRGGVALTAQEVRACIFRGPFNDLLHELADADDFRYLVKLQEAQQDDGTREELVLKFFAYLDWADRYDGQVTLFLNQYMREQQNSFDVAGGRKLFVETTRRLKSLLPDGPFLRSNYYVTPQNQFEAVMVALGKLLRGKKKTKKPAKGWLDDKALVQFSTKGTNTRSAFEGRISRALELLAG
jgi:hypothetical protein